MVGACLKGNNICFYEKYREIAKIAKSPDLAEKPLQQSRFCGGFFGDGRWRIAKELATNTHQNILNTKHS